MKMKWNKQSGVTLLEVLAAAVVIFIILSATMIAYFITIVQSTRSVIDIEFTQIAASIEDSIRAGVRSNLAADRRSFFADIEGVRVFIPLPQEGQPGVDLPDYNEDINGDGIRDFGEDNNCNGIIDPGEDLDADNVLDPGADIDWDGDCLLDAPNFAKPEFYRDNNAPFITELGGVNNYDHVDGVDSDGDGVVDDTRSDPAGLPESFAPVVNGGACGGNPCSAAYNGLDDDGDGVVDDMARYLYPLGLLAQIDSGYFFEDTTLAVQPAWVYRSANIPRPAILPPMNEDRNNDGFVRTYPRNLMTYNFSPSAGVYSSNLVEAALNITPVPPFPSNRVTNQALFLPDMFEDLNGDGRITLVPAGVNIDTPPIDGAWTAEYFQYAEDFNLNGFLDVPSPAYVPGMVYAHQRYSVQPVQAGGGAFNLGGFVNNTVLMDRLSLGMFNTGAANPEYPVGGSFVPYEAINLAYSEQIQRYRNFGYTLRVEKLQRDVGQQIARRGYGREFYKITVSIYFDYFKTLTQFREAFLPTPTPIRVVEFEVQLP